MVLTHCRLRVMETLFTLQREACGEPVRVSWPLRNVGDSRLAAVEGEPG